LRQHAEVTVIGRSLGSGVALHLASLRPVARLVLVTPYDSMVELGARHYPMFPIRWIMRDRFESWRYAPLVTAPTTLITAENDGIIPRSSSNLLLTRFTPGVARQVVVAGAGHNTISDDPSYGRLLSRPAP
jgi:pimeloyl-ACP methyl ester carboxylesterase